MKTTKLALVTAVALLGAGCNVTRKPPADPCEPNPCTQPNKTTCVNDAGNALCQCNEGFVMRPSGACEPLSAANCPEHGGDTSEPDDCMARAQALAFSTTPTQRTIDPVGDFDFFTFTATANHVYRAKVIATGASLSPRADVFDSFGRLMATAEGGTTIELSTKLYTGGQHYLRVMHSPIDPTVATGAYTITLKDEGVEDHADGPDGATVITADLSGTQPQDHTGSFEFAEDQDWFQFSASTSTAYRITFSGTPPQLALWTNPDSGQPVWTVEQSVVDFDVPQGGTAYLSVYPTTSNSYSFTFIR